MNRHDVMINLSRLQILLSGAVFVCVVAAFTSARSSERESTPTTAWVESTLLKNEQELLREKVREPSAIETALKAYVLASMQAWNAEPMAGTASHLPEIASDIVDVVLEEPCIWSPSDGSREAILLARIAWWESRFRDYVDDGNCNIWARKCTTMGVCNLTKLSHEQQKLMMLGTCDGGIAVGIWQVHYPYLGIALMPDGSWHNADYDTGKAKQIVHREEALKDRKVNARVAYAMARQSIRHNAGLCQYSGEPGPCPKGDARLSSALSWSVKHPFHM